MKMGGRGDLDVFGGGTISAFDSQSFVGKVKVRISN